MEGGGSFDPKQLMSSSGLLTSTITQTASSRRQTDLPQPDETDSFVISGGILYKILVLGINEMVLIPFL
jgi:hypothetical protein